ncbi:LPXTG-site transpeptidase (sortase) family protein [Halalkalibacter nanhaiisediminis]|uniref:LPXTG-site transpeptidase (Sortase) family protein n=2 Tax=Halalkalibacter nanhaiisediminis TaxID=688079 RepID=A0A562QJG3_9BACI|nr:LPXTG-site transpeptidase (sortase) family protein [Halalkalibacter nanhaiisediminis]
MHLKFVNMKHGLIVVSCLLYLQILYTPFVVQSEISITGTEPRLLKIPSLSIEAPIVGVSGDELAQLPSDGDTIFWYKEGTNPGGRGSAVLSGHFDDYEGPAIFYSLKELKVGEMVYIVDKHNNILMFEVEEVKSFNKNAAKVEQVFKMNSGSYLQLVTCDGYYSRREQTHSHRLVVRARRVGESHSYDPINRQA